ncbi:hypothetical protein [Celeribacter ethanolicus]|uniref:hypothetical protein n=1 Tax=Celeribacter ethanolicus TaxID=1758178 RepID=UPI0012FE7725|nr:hypothetical protein [Celeribacter ethanolicus]
MATRSPANFSMLQWKASQESWREASMLSLSEAQKTGQLEEFIAQEEARGVGPISAAEFDENAAKVIKTPPQDDQTSGSLPRDGSHGK